MIHQTETHSLHVGDRFGFTPDQQNGLVDETGIIDYWGDPLFLYRDAAGLHGHVSDHTPVWVIE